MSKKGAAGSKGELRAIVAADLMRAARLLVKVQDEIDPQFRIATPEGDFYIAMTLEAEVAARELQLGVLKLYMMWKQAVGFTLASELAQPDALACFGVTLRDAVGCMARIRREPKPWSLANIGEPSWLPREAMDRAIVDLLPRGAAEISSRQRQLLENWFGPRGRFPAVHIESGELREL